MVVKQYLEPGVCKIVNENTIDAGYWLRVTAVGSQDELINDLGFYRYITAASGAVLDAVADGLRVSSLAAGAALAGGSAEKLRVSISKQPSKTVVDSDKILIEDTSGNLFQTTRSDVSTGGQVSPYSLRGNAGSSPASEQSLPKSGIPVANPSDGSVVVGYGLTGKLETYFYDPIVNLITEFPLNADTVRILNDTGGVGATIPAATYTTAGVMTAADKTTLDNLQSFTTDLDIGAPSPLTVTVTNTSGTDAVIPAATYTDAGVMTAADKQLLDGISASGTNLTVTHTTETFTIVNSTGTDGFVDSATTVQAGAMTSEQVLTIQLIEPGQPFNSVLSCIGGVPTWDTRSSYTLRPWLTSARLLGWDTNGNIGVFSPDTSGTGGLTNIIHMNGHSLTSNDIGKPFSASTKAVWDSTDTNDWPTAILKAIIDVNTVEAVLPGEELDIASALFQPGYNPTVDGAWLFWDSDNGYWVSGRPATTSGDITEQLEVTQASGTGFYGVAKDHGPLGSGGTGGTAPDPVEGTEEVLLSAGVPIGTPPAGFKHAIDTVNNRHYQSNGVAWVLVEPGSVAAGDGATSVNVAGKQTVTADYSIGAWLATFSGGVENQVIHLISTNELCTVQSWAQVKLKWSENWNVGVLGGSLTLKYIGGVWHEIARTDYTDTTNLIAG